MPPARHRRIRRSRHRRYGSTGYLARRSTVRSRTSPTDSNPRGALLADTGSDGHVLLASPAVLTRPGGCSLCLRRSLPRQTGVVPSRRRCPPDLRRTIHGDGHGAQNLGVQNSLPGRIHPRRGGHEVAHVHLRFRAGSVQNMTHVRRAISSGNDQCFRRVGSPALRPGAGLRWPGLRPWTRATPECLAQQGGACATGYPVPRRPAGTREHAWTAHLGKTRCSRADIVAQRLELCAGHEHSQPSTVRER